MVTNTKGFVEEKYDPLTGWTVPTQLMGHENYLSAWEISNQKMCCAGVQKS